MVDPSAERQLVCLSASLSYQVESSFDRGLGLAAWEVASLEKAIWFESNGHCASSVERREERACKSTFEHLNVYNWEKDQATKFLAARPSLITVSFTELTEKDDEASIYIIKFSFLSTEEMEEKVMIPAVLWSEDMHAICLCCVRRRPVSRIHLQRFSKLRK